jgi:hypothetical protein
VILLLLFVANTTADAQQIFRYQAVIERVDSAGFYRIALQPRLIAKCKTDLSDLRIADSKNNFIPFIVAGEYPVFKSKTFIAFPVIHPLTADTDLSVVIENASRLTIKTLWLDLKNTDVSRTFTLSGSEDLKNWFAIKENIPLVQAGEQATDRYQFSISFPAGAYRYFKLQVNERHKNPINILGAGVYSNYSQPQKYITLPTPVVRQFNSANNTILAIQFDDFYQVDKLELQLAGPKFFRRAVSVYRVNGRIRSEIDQEEFISNKPAEVFPSVKTKRLEIEIINNDNQPLLIKKVIAFQSAQYAYAYLETGKLYRFVFGNPAARKPVYDLSFFTDSLNHPLKTLRAAQVTLTGAEKLAPGSVLANYTLLRWVAIAVALSILCWLTLKLTNELKNRTASKQQEAADK